MAKVYLKKGDAITLNHSTTLIGQSETFVDTLFNWDDAEGAFDKNSVASYRGNGYQKHTNNFLDNLDFEVYIEDESKKLWYDDKSGQ